MHKYFIPGFFLMLTVGTISCAYHVEDVLYPPDTCNKDSVTYSGTVLPILQVNCYECHSDAHVSESQVPLEGYSNVLIKVQDGKLINAIRHTGDASPMPKDREPLSECDIEKIEKWVLDGAPDN